MEFLQYTGYASALSTVLVALVAAFLNNRIFDKGANWMRIYFFVAAAAEIIMFVFIINSTNNLQIANAFCLAQFVLVYLALISWLPNNTIKNGLFIFFAFAVVLLTFYFIRVFSYHYFDSFSSSIEGVLLTFLSAYVLYHLTGDHSDYLYRNYKFWFVIAVFIYFGISSMVFATSNYVLTNSLFLRNYTWVINTFLTILANAFFIKGLLCLKKKKI
jgi:hypothetical protein